MSERSLWALLALVAVLTVAANSVARGHGSWFWYGTANFLAGFVCSVILRAIDGGDDD